MLARGAPLSPHQKTRDPSESPGREAHSHIGDGAISARMIAGSMPRAHRMREWKHFWAPHAKTPRMGLVLALSRGFPRRDDKRKLPLGSSSTSEVVDAGGLKPNVWKRIERLSLAWERVSSATTAERCSLDSTAAGVIANPGRRARTPLTHQEVDAIRTTRELGTSAHTIARQFDLHRATVWEKTR